MSEEKGKFSQIFKNFRNFNDVFSLLCDFRFSTSKQTLTLINDTFFTSLLSGRISSLRDESGAIFIDRDPTLFSIILNFLRTKDIDTKLCDIRQLRHEAEYYNIAPLIKRLILCEDLSLSSCGDILFYGCLPAPSKYSFKSVLKLKIILFFLNFQTFQFKSLTVHQLQTHHHNFKRDHHLQHHQNFLVPVLLQLRSQMHDQDLWYVFQS